MKKRNKNRSSNEQLLALLSYMEEHSLFARGQIMKLGHSGHDKYKSMWKNLTAMLNVLGPVKKDEAGWEKCWKSLKAKGKEKKATYICSSRQTGNNDVQPLNEFYLRICDIYGDHGVGLSVIPELGIPENGHKDCDKEKRSSATVCSFVDELDIAQPSIHHIHEATIEIIHQFTQTFIRSINSFRLQYRKEIMSKNRPTKAQLSLLISFMERNKDFARGDIADLTLADEQWKELTDNLNSIGSECRSVTAWKRCWDHQVVIATKSKNDFISKNGSLSETDKRIVFIMDGRIPQEQDRAGQSQKISTIDSDEDDGPQVKKPRKTTQVPDYPINLIKKQNEVVQKLANDLTDCFRAQNKVMKEGFESINLNLHRLIEEIVSRFNSQPIDWLETTDEAAPFTSDNDEVIYNKEFEDEHES